MTWKLHLLLKKHLEGYGFEVITTRKDQAKDLALYNRGTTAKGCDLFISIHSNAVGSKGNESIDYPIVYVPLSGKGNEIGGDLADCIADVMGTKQKGRTAYRKSSSGKEYYGVLRGAAAVGVPGLLIEHSFHTHTRSTKWLMVESNLDKLAAAEAKVIAEYYGMTAQTDKPATLYRVQVGAFSVKANADRYLQQVKAAGFPDAFIAEAGGSLWRVQIGAFSVKANAEKCKEEAKAKGFPGFVTK
jgi:hypothetical protein